MRLLNSMRTRITAVFYRARMNAEMEEELRSHIAHRADDLERSGMDRAMAERRARIEFGGREKYKEEIRETIGGNFISTFVQDVRYSCRVLLKSPSFTIAAALTLVTGWDYLTAGLRHSGSAVTSRVDPLPPAG